MRLSYLASLFIVHSDFPSQYHIHTRTTVVFLLSGAAPSCGKGLDNGLFIKYRSNLIINNELCEAFGGLLVVVVIVEYC